MYFNLIGPRLQLIMLGTIQPQTKARLHLCLDRNCDEIYFMPLGDEVLKSSSRNLGIIIFCFYKLLLNYDNDEDDC